jgi:hypothetical protein
LTHGNKENHALFVENDAERRRRHMAEAQSSVRTGRQRAPDSAQERAKTDAGPGADTRPMTDAQPTIDERPVIRAKCESYACRECRTKTGWPHQKWCTLSRLTEPDCADCRYWSVKKAGCDHPARRRGGDRR